MFTVNNTAASSQPADDRVPVPPVSMHDKVPHASTAGPSSQVMVSYLPYFICLIIQGIVLAAAAIRTTSYNTMYVIFVTYM